MMWLQAWCWLLPMLLIVCYTDFKMRMIKNIYCLMIFIMFFIRYLIIDLLNPSHQLLGDLANLMPMIVCFLIMIFFLCLMGIWAAGDSKLLFALMPWVVLNWQDFLLICTVTGGALAVVYFILNKLHKTKQPGIPYGIALSFAALISAG